MLNAKVTNQNLANRCGVDVKTVERRLQDEARVPHLRHQWAVAEALGVETAVLRPDAIRNTVKTGPDKEVLTVYPYRSACPKSIWRNLINAARNEIVFAGYTNYFLWLEHPNLAKVLRRKAQQGCKIRFLVGDPESEVTRRREEVENVPADRVHPRKDHAVGDRAATRRPRSRGPVRRRAHRHERVPLRLGDAGHPSSGQFGGTRLADAAPAAVPGRRLVRPVRVPRFRAVEQRP